MKEVQNSIHETWNSIIRTSTICTDMHRHYHMHINKNKWSQKKTPWCGVQLNVLPL